MIQLLDSPIVYGTLVSAVIAIFVAVVYSIVHAAIGSVVECYGNSKRNYMQPLGVVFVLAVIGVSLSIVIHRLVLRLPTDNATSFVGQFKVVALRPPPRMLVTLESESGEIIPYVLIAPNCMNGANIVVGNVLTLHYTRPSPTLKHFTNLSTVFRCDTQSTLPVTHQELTTTQDE